MGNSLLDTHARALLVVEGTEGEGEGTRLLLDLREGGTRGLHLELVVDVVGALVDRGTRLVGAGLGVRAGDDENVDTVDLTLLEGDGVVVTAELGRGVEEDALLAVGDVLLVLAREHALDGDAVVLLGDLVNNLGDVPVLVAGLDGAHGGLSGVVGSLHDIGSDGVGLAKDDGLGVGDSVAVDLDTDLDLDNVAVLEDDLGVRVKGGDVRDDVVDRDTGGESRACDVRDRTQLNEPCPSSHSPLGTLTPFLALL